MTPHEKRQPLLNETSRIPAATPPSVAGAVPESQPAMASGAAFSQVDAGTPALITTSDAGTGNLTRELDARTASNALISKGQQRFEGSGGSRVNKVLVPASKEAPGSRVEEEWIDGQSLSVVLSVTKRNVHKRLASIPSVIRRSVKSGRTLRHEYYLPSLPPDIQAAWHAHTGQPEPLHLLLEAPPAETLPANENDPRWRQAQELAGKVARVTALVAAAPKGERLRALAEGCATERLKLGTFYRLQKRLERGGVGALIRHNPLKGVRRSLPPADQAFLYSLYVDETAPLPFHCYEAYAAKCREENRKPAHFATVYRFLRSVADSAAHRQRIGPEYWDKHYSPVVRRDPREYEPGACWNSDGRTSDVWVYLHTRAEYERLKVEDPKSIRIGRPELIWWMDLGSRHKWCKIAATLTSEGVAESFISQFEPDPSDPDYLLGVLPKKVYIDNGHEYKNRYISGRTRSHTAALSPYQLGMMQNLHIEVTHAIVRNARAKAIERSFATDANRFDRYQPGYCGKDSKFRPEKLKRLVKQGKLQTLDEFEAALNNYLRWLDSREHSAIKAAPAALWAKAPRVRVKRASLRAILLKSGQALVRQDGIHLFRERYWSDDLALFIGERVQVRWDPGDISQITVIHRGQVINAASAAYMPSQPSEADFRAANRAKKAARQAVAEYDKSMRILIDPKEAFPHLRPQPEPPALPAAAVAGALPLVTVYDQLARQQAERADERAQNVASMQAYVEAPTVPAPQPRKALKLLPDE
jgi:hypothetical protein